MLKLLALLMVLMTLSGCLSLKSDNSKVLAEFDGTKVTENDLLKKVHSLPEQVRKIAADRKKDLIDDMAAEHFLLKEAQRRGLDKEADVKDLFSVAQKKILIAKLIEKEVDEKIRIEAQEIEKYYEFHQEEFMTPLLLRASHILVKAEEEALAVKASLDSGADFEETARQRSTDATAIRGGDLGFFQKGQFVPEFEEAAFAMEKGQTSAPVKTAFGYHIIRLNDRVEPRLRELKAVRNVVRDKIAKEKRSKAFLDFVQKLKGNAKIDIDETALEAVSFASASKASK